MSIHISDRHGSTFSRKYISKVNDSFLKKIFDSLRVRKYDISVFTGWSCRNVGVNDRHRIFLIRNILTNSKAVSYN